MKPLFDTRPFQWINNIFQFYTQGFREMTVGKTLWFIIGFKLLIMFGILKLFFFPNFLSSNFDTNAERSAHVLDQISSSQTTSSQPVEGDVHD